MRAALLKRPISGDVGLDFERAFQVNPALVQRICAYDPCLVVYWDRNLTRWGLCRITEHGHHFIMLWQTDDGAYLPLDNRLAEKIASMDLRPPRLDSARSSREAVRRMEDAQDAIKEKSLASWDDDIQHLTRENRRYLRKKIAKAFNLP